jgi:hypothetical protein
MATSNTALASTFNNDTYRLNEAPRKVALKYRIASEHTGEGSTGKDEDATSHLVERNQYRITSQFRRRVLERSNIIPSVIDDIKQKFSGVVTGIDFENEEFTARISDIDNPNNPDELVTLGFDEILEADQRQLTKGDSFIWYIGYVEGEMISREGFSKIRFRHLPSWSQQEIDTASSRAEELAHFFNGDQDTRS